MNVPTLQYYVSHSEESDNEHEYIPTYGHPATNFDLYRTTSIEHVNDLPESWCLTDTDAEGALGRIIDGPIRSKTDIESAEAAICALLLHEHIQIVVPVFKAHFSNGTTNYIRLDKEERSEAAFTAFNIAPCSDSLFAVERLEIADGMVVGSSNINSIAKGLALNNLSSAYRPALALVGDFALALPMDFQAATHYACPEFSFASNQGASGFIDELYSRIHRPWMEMAKSAPQLHVNVSLPPLIAIVLSRASHRSNIPQVLAELRDELTDVRLKLIEMNNFLASTTSQADIIKYSTKMNSMFDAIVPESLLTTAERRKRSLMSVFQFFKPTLPLYSIALDPLSASPDKFKELYSSISNAVATDSKIVSRNVASAKFAELLRVESMRDSLTTHFSRDEIGILLGR